MKEKALCIANAVICTAVTSSVSNCTITPELGLLILMPSGLLACWAFAQTDWCYPEIKKALADVGTSNKRK